MDTHRSIDSLPENLEEPNLAEPSSAEPGLVEPWLRGTLVEVPAVGRGVMHALELAKEDILRWSGKLTDEELEASVLGLPAVAFQMRHMVRSVDRLLTYAERGALSSGQLGELRTETVAGGSRAELFDEVAAGLTASAARVRALAGMDLELARFVGKKRLKSSLGGLLVHVADHTQRHAGQLVTTVKVVVAMRVEGGG
jgi:hypothetical protein